MSVLPPPVKPVWPGVGYCTDDTQASGRSATSSETFEPGPVEFASVTVAVETRVPVAPAAPRISSAASTREFQSTSVLIAVARCVIPAGVVRVAVFQSP